MNAAHNHMTSQWKCPYNGYHYAKRLMMLMYKSYLQVKIVLFSYLHDLPGFLMIQVRQLLRTTFDRYNLSRTNRTDVIQLQNVEVWLISHGFMTSL